MTLLCCMLFVVMLAWFENLYLFVCLHLFFKCFYILSGSIFSYFYVKNPKNLIDIILYYHKHVLPCTFVLMTLCICEYSLFFMHSYHCGRNLDIYVIVVNRSSNLSWMISQWFCWSWNLHRLVTIYLPTYLFIYFSLVFSLKAQQM